MRNSDYRFDVQLAAGLAVEGWFYELTRGGDKFEVKNDRIALDTFRVYVETAHQPGRVGPYVPSGINTTEADCWIFALGDPPRSFVGVPTEWLRWIVTNHAEREVEQPRGSCPTRGVLVAIEVLLGAGALMKAAA